MNEVWERHRKLAEDLLMYFANAEQPRIPKLPMMPLPDHLKLKIVQKLNTSTFIRSMRTCKYMNSMIEDSKTKFYNRLEQTLDLRKDNKVVVSGLVRMPFPIHRHVEIKEKDYNTLRYFGFSDIRMECGLELYNRLMVHLGISYGCSYWHLSPHPYDYVPILCPSRISTGKLDSDFFEAVKNLNVDTLYCSLEFTDQNEADDVTATIPYLAKTVEIVDRGRTNISAGDVAATLVKKWLSGTGQFKLKNYYFSSRLKYDEMFPKELRDRGCQCTNESKHLHSDETTWPDYHEPFHYRNHGEQDKYVAALFPYEGYKFALLFGKEMDSYTLHFDITSIEDIPETCDHRIDPRRKATLWKFLKIKLQGNLGPLRK